MLHRSSVPLPFALAVLVGTAAVPACLVHIPSLVSNPAIGADDAGIDAEAGPNEASPEADAALPEADVVTEASPEADAHVCEAGTVACDGDVSDGCHDLTTDPDHCGACGHDCIGGECLGGVCQPVLLAGGIQSPFALVKDLDFIFGTGDATNGQVWKVPIQGCTAPESCAALMSSAGARYQDIAIDETAVYFTDKSADRVMRIQKTGSGECNLATDQQAPVGIAVDDEYVYWGAQAGDVVRRVSKSCGSANPPVDLVTGTPSPQIVRLDGSGLYWTSATGGLVTWATLDGASSEPVWSGTTPGDFMLGLAMDDLWVYWREGYQFPVGGTGRLVRAPKSRTGAIEVLAENQDSPRYVAIDATHVCWTAGDSVRRVAKSGTEAVETLAAGFPSVHGILVDGPAVYFCTYSGGKLFKVAK